MYWDFLKKERSFMNMKKVIIVVIVGIVVIVFVVLIIVFVSIVVVEVGDIFWGIV